MPTQLRSHLSAKRRLTRSNKWRPTVDRCDSPRVCSQRPPVTSKMLPVTYDASGERSQRMALAISSARPARPSDGAFRCGIVHVFGGASETRRGGRNVDDGAAAAPVQIGHAPNRFARARERADHVRGKDPYDSLGAHGFELHLRFENARVVDQRRQWTELAIDALEQAQNRRLGGDVPAHEDGLAALPANLSDDVRRGGFVLPIVDANGVAASRSEERRCCADAATASGDDEDLLHCS